MQQQDYIERMIAQVAAAIARALGIARGGEPEQAERELSGTWASVVGLPRGDVMRLDAATLRALIGDRRVVAAALLDAEAELMRSRQQDAAAAHLNSLAARLRE